MPTPLPRDGAAPRKVTYRLVDGKRVYERVRPRTSPGAWYSEPADNSNSRGKPVMLNTARGEQRLTCKEAVELVHQLWLALEDAHRAGHPVPLRAGPIEGLDAAQLAELAAAVKGKKKG